MDSLLSLLAGGQNILLLIGAALVALLGAFAGGRVSGASRERDKQAGRDKAAVEEQLEMHREASEAERQAAALTEEAARKEASKWSKR